MYTNIEKAFQEIYTVCKDIWQIATDYTWNKFKKDIIYNNNNKLKISIVETPLDVVRLIINWTALGYETGKSAQQYYESHKNKIILSQNHANLMYEIFDKLNKKIYN